MHTSVHGGKPFSGLQDMLIKMNLTGRTGAKAALVEKHLMCDTVPPEVKHSTAMPTTYLIKQCVHSVISTIKL